MQELAQDDIIEEIIRIDMVIDRIDDGNHNEDVSDLMRTSNELFSKLTPEYRKKCRKNFIHLGN